MKELFGEKLIKLLFLCINKDLLEISLAQLNADFLVLFLFSKSKLDAFLH